MTFREDFREDVKAFDAAARAFWHELVKALHIEALLRVMNRAILAADRWIRAHL